MLGVLDFVGFAGEDLVAPDLDFFSFGASFEAVLKALNFLIKLDFLLAALFLWMTFLFAALSSNCIAWSRISLTLFSSLFTKALLKFEIWVFI